MPLKVFFEEAEQNKILLLKIKTAVNSNNTSAMADKLEDAAANNNLAFIDSHIEDFIENFKNLLANIKPCIDKYAEEKELNSNSKEKGTTKILQLQLQLKELSEAIELINISDIEAIITTISTFDWSPETIAELRKIQDAILYFDYDKALEIVHSLQKHVR